MEKEKEYFIRGIQSTREGFNGEVLMWEHAPSNLGNWNSIEDRLQVEDALSERIDQLYEQARKRIEDES